MIVPLETPSTCLRTLCKIRDLAAAPIVSECCIVALEGNHQLHSSLLIFMPAFQQATANRGHTGTSRTAWCRPRLSHSRRTCRTKKPIWLFAGPCSWSGASTGIRGRADSHARPRMLTRPALLQMTGQLDRARVWFEGLTAKLATWPVASDHFQREGHSLSSQVWQCQPSWLERLTDSDGNDPSPGQPGPE